MAARAAPCAHGPRRRNGLSPAAAALVTALALQGAAAQDCTKLCDWDSGRTGSCHVSRGYSNAVIQALEGPPWSEIAGHITACEAQAAGDCGAAASCELNQAGQCSASRAWAVGRLAAAPEAGGAGLGAERCGALGHMLNRSTPCLAAGNAAACQGISGCTFDFAKGSCGLSKDTALAVLRGDYKEQLMRVSLRRQRCNATGSLAACAGDCEWSRPRGQCLLRAVDTLLAVMDDDCPLRQLLRSHAECDRGEGFDNETVCSLRKRADGLPECTWRDGRCEADPMTLEFELLTFLGLQSSQVREATIAAEAKCIGYMTPGACSYECAPPVDFFLGGASRPRAAGAAAWTALALVWGAGRRLA